MQVGVSFSVLDPTEIGIAQNTIQRGIDSSKIYTSGRWFLGLGKTFIRYPTTRQNIYFGSSSDSSGSASGGPLVVRTPGGQVTVEASLQYSLIPSRVVDLYGAFQQNYHARLVTAASSAIQTAMQGADLQQFYTNRTLVQNLTFTALQNAFNGLYATCHDFQLRRVTLPATNEQQVVNKIVTEQRAKTAQNVQEQQNVDAATTVIVGEISQTIAVLEANRTQEAAVIVNQAVSTAKALRIDSESGAYTSFQQALGFNNTELLRYIYYKNLKATGASASKLAVGFDAMYTSF